MTNAMMRWWGEPEIITRYVCDILAGELARRRPGRAPRPFPWAAGLRIETDLGIDSLERVHLATALAEAVHLYRSGIDDSLLVKPTVGEWVETAVSSLDRFSAEVIFKTSGSTGEPKWCLHPLADLAQEAAVHAAAFPAARRVLTAVPSHHIYGFLFTVLLPAALGVPVLDVRAHAPARLGELIAAGDVVVAYPEYWSAFIRSVPRVAPGAAGVTSTAPCPAATATGVVERGIGRLVEIYGSSETAGIGRRDDPAAAFELLPFWRRGTADGELIRSAADGGERVVAAPDRLEWESPRRLRPAGRTEGAVQVGGINVFPARIAAALAARPGVAAAAVRLMRPEEGDRLKAFVVPQFPGAGEEGLRDELWDWIDANLTAPERPKSIVFGPALPAGEMGKSADWPVGTGPSAIR